MKSEDRQTSGTTKASIGFGMVLAITMSWTANKAVLWALFHGVLGWIYVIYYLIMKDGWSWL